jgi:hypothetical protein
LEQFSAGLRIYVFDLGQSGSRRPNADVRKHRKRADTNSQKSGINGEKPAGAAPFVMAGLVPAIHVFPG